MPSPSRPCSEPNCPNLQPCALHPARRPFATAHRSSNLYQTPRWRTVRQAQLTIEPYCRACRLEGKRTPATFADHITPPGSDAVLFWTTPLQSLCRYHSNAKTGRETRQQVSR